MMLVEAIDRTFMPTYLPTSTTLHTTTLHIHTTTHYTTTHTHHTRSSVGAGPAGVRHPTRHPSLAVRSARTCFGAPLHTGESQSGPIMVRSERNGNTIGRQGGREGGREAFRKEHLRRAVRYSHFILCTRCSAAPVPPAAPPRTTRLAETTSMVWYR